MFITVGTNDYELKTKLGTSIKLEDKFKMPLTQMLANISNAEIPEVIDILAIAADKLKDKDFRDALTENWDYSDLQAAVQELFVRLMFSGTDEQIEKKIDKHPASEDQKNAFREMLGLPIKAVLTEDNSSEQPTE